MLRSTVALALVSLATPLACTQGSSSPPVVSAPIASTPVSVPAPPPAEVVAAAPPSASSQPAPAGSAAQVDPDQPPRAAWRSCKADAECAAVPKIGCCHNGYLEAVNTSHKDDYARSFTCPEPAPRCPMFIIRDAGVAKCDVAAHLCVMVRP